MGIEDLKGKKFGEWEPIKYIGNCRWLCRCSCGVERSIRTYDLKHGKSKSCGHNTNRFIDLTDQQFGEWKVLEYVGNGKWSCKCSCGTVQNMSGYDLTHGISKHCKNIIHTTKIIPGNKYGDWEVLEYIGDGKWKCRCSCGKVLSVAGQSLLSGASKSCGHSKLTDLAGKTIGSLKVLRYLGEGKWECKCSCGNIVSVFGSNLKSNKTTSCGCKTRQKFKETMFSRYGAADYAKLTSNRTEKQIEYIRNKDTFTKCIQDNFKGKPNTHELSILLGVNETSTLKIIHKFNAEGLVELGNNAISAYEKEIYNHFGGERSNRTILRGKEIDLYYPDNKLGVEINGDYWHSEIFKHPKYHQEKTVEAAKSGVQLIHIFEHELKSDIKRNKIYSLLEEKIKPYNNKVIYGRKCDIRSISKDEACRFMDAYHLQGSIPSTIELGLIHNNELIAVITFGNPRYDKNYQYELLRLAFKTGVIVIGGFNKLMSYFINVYSPTSIVTYCDISKFSGNSYIKAGFKPLGITKPNYIWFNSKTGKVLTRYQTMKHKLIALNLGSLNDTEESIMEGLGYVRIYDCGNLKFDWRNT